MKDVVVELRQVTKRFGGLEAVKSLSLAAEEGEFLTLLGPSGCGKTTTLRLISGFEVPDEGTVAIAGKVVNPLPPFRRDVNTVFQNYALFPHLTVFQNVAYGLEVKGLDRATVRRKVGEMLERIALPDKASSLPSELSGGQKQRIALARALVNEPKVLLLDEPLGALDAKLRRAMQIELKHMQSALGITFIYVTHDQEEALVMSDRVAVINEGRILQLDTPAVVFEHPADRFVADFMGTGNFLRGSVLVRDGANLRVAVGRSETLIVPASEVDVDAAGRVALAIRAQKVKVFGHEPDGTNVLEVSLKEVIYMGPTIRLVAALADSQMVVAEGFADGLPFDYRFAQKGQRLWFRLPSEALIPYPE